MSQICENGTKHNVPCHCRINSLQKLLRSAFWIHRHQLIEIGFAAPIIPRRIFYGCNRIQNERIHCTGKCPCGYTRGIRSWKTNFLSIYNVRRWTKRKWTEMERVWCEWMSKVFQRKINSMRDWALQERLCCALKWTIKIANIEEWPFMNDWKIKSFVPWIECECYDETTAKSAG